MSLDALAVTSNEAREGVDARELHRALGVGRDLSTWIKDQVERYGLVEGQDYLLTKTGEQVPHQGGLRSREVVGYTLSLNAAKLIALGQNNAAAKAARAALLKIEEAWNRPAAVMARALQMAQAELVHTRQEAAQALAIVAPKVEAFDRLAAAGGDLCLRKAAKVLRLPEKQFISRLLALAVLFRDAQGRLEPYAIHVSEGRFRLRTVVIGEEQDGTDRVTVQTMVTPAGLIWLSRRYPPAATPAPPALASAAQMESAQ